MINLANVANAIDDPKTAMHAHPCVKQQAVAMAHAAVAAMAPFDGRVKASPYTVDIHDSYKVAQELVKSASDHLMQVRRDTLTDAAQAVAGLK